MKPWLRNVLIGIGLLVLVSVVYVAVMDAGVIRVGYAESRNPQHEQLRQQLAAWRAFDVAAAQLDSVYLVPEDLTIWFTDCGQVNAFYNPDTRQIHLCYELVTDLFRRYSAYSLSDSVIAGAVWQTMFFVFYHEMGHALIHVLDLPITGREEDAVDQLATLVLLNGGDTGRNAALQGASWFWISQQRGGTPFWDQHSMNEQRYYNIVCWVYGSNPEAHQVLLGGNWRLPVPRAQGCPSEFQRMSNAWSAMLEEHTY